MIVYCSVSYDLCHSVKYLSLVKYVRVVLEKKKTILKLFSIFSVQLYGIAAFCAFD